MGKEEIIVEFFDFRREPQFGGIVEIRKPLSVARRHLFFERALSRKEEHLGETGHALGTYFLSQGEFLEAFVLITKHEHRVRKALCLRNPIFCRFYPRLEGAKFGAILQALVDQVLQPERLVSSAGNPR